MEVNSSIPISYAGIVDHGFSSRQALGSSLVTQLSPYQRSPLPLVVDERSRSRRHERYAPWPIWSYWISSKRVHDCIAKLGSSKSFSYRLMRYSCHKQQERRISLAPDDRYKIVMSTVLVSSRHYESGPRPKIGPWCCFPSLPHMLRCLAPPQLSYICLSAIFSPIVNCFNTKGRCWPPYHSIGCSRPHSKVKSAQPAQTC